MGNYHLIIGNFNVGTGRSFCQNGFKLLQYLFNATLFFQGQRHDHHHIYYLKGPDHGAPGKAPANKNLSYIQIVCLIQYVLYILVAHRHRLQVPPDRCA